MPFPFLAQLAVGFVMSFLGYLITPKPKADQPPSTKDLDSPTAEAGRPIPVVWGSMTVKGLNNLGYWDKLSVHRDADTGGKK